MSNEGTKHIRKPEDTKEKWLCSIGWKMVGLTLWQYPNTEAFRGYHTKERAIELSEEFGLDIYCPACGACGEDGCCSPDRCRCFYLEHYNNCYKDLLEENEKYYNFIKKVSLTPDVRLDELPAEASDVIHGVISNYDSSDTKPPEIYCSSGFTPDGAWPDPAYDNFVADGQYPPHVDESLGKNPLK